MHVPRLGGKQQRRENLLNDRSHGWKRQPSGTAAHPLALNVGVRDRRQHGVVLPAGPRPALEVVEAKFALQLLVLCSMAQR
jgi:hypothetical protein